MTFGTTLVYYLHTTKNYDKCNTHFNLDFNSDNASPEQHYLHAPQQSQKDKNYISHIYY